MSTWQVKLKAFLFALKMARCVAADVFFWSYSANLERGSFHLEKASLEPQGQAIRLDWQPKPGYSRTGRSYQSIVLYWLSGGPVRSAYLKMKLRQRSGAAL